MPSNITLDAGDQLGSDVTTKQRTHDGDTTQSQAVTLAGVTGTEDSYSFEDIAGTAANGLDVDVTRVGGTVTISGAVTGPLTDTELRSSAVPVSGTITETNSTAILADTAAIDTATAAMNAKMVTGTVIGDVNAVQSGPWNVTNVSGTVSLPTGASTAANQATIITDTNAMVVDLAALEVLVTAGNVDLAAIEVLITAGNVDLAAIEVLQTTVASPVATISATPLQRVAIYDASDSQITSFGGAGGTSETDDSAFTAGTDLGTPMMGFASADTVDAGDVGVLGMTTDRELKVDITSNSAGVGGGVSYTEDEATANPIVGTASMMERDDALGGLTPAEGDWAALRCTAEGALWVEDFNSEAILADTAAIDTATAASAASLVDVETNTDFGAVVGGGTEATALRVTIANNSTGVVTVDGTVALSGDLPDTAAGDLAAMVVDLAAIEALAISIDSDTNDIKTSVQVMDNVVVSEDTPADANPAGNLVMAMRDDEVGSTAVTSADNDITALRCNQFGELKVTQVPDSTSEYKYAAVNAATGDTSIVAAAGAGIKIRVLAVMVVAGGTTTCRFESGAGGTALTGVMPLVVNSGFTLPFNPAGWFETGDNAALSLESTGDIDGCVTYVEI